MRCHYEVLGVSRTATDDELKRTYRRLALQWHPDKNPERQEECHRMFTEIQQAYDVLSDPQERAWYDKYREVILRGRGDDYDDESIDLMPYFQPSVYSGYGDGEQGFFAVFGKVFKTVAEEDDTFDDPGSQEQKMPEFGNSTSSYDEVVHSFYAHWQSYCTKRSFVWKETFDTRQAPDRYTARRMEKENKKQRDAAKKERNEIVRRLVAFVRKRDPRVKARQQQLKERQEEIARRMEEERRRQKKERMKEMEVPYKEQEWMSGMDDGLRAIEDHLKEEFAGDASADELSDDQSDQRDGTAIDDDIVDDLFCIACGKAFRSAKAMENHGRSKKHKENVSLLRQQLTDESIENGLDSYLDLDDGSTSLPDGDHRSRKPKKKKQRSKDPDVSGKEFDVLTVSLEEASLGTSITADSFKSDEIPCQNGLKEATGSVEDSSLSSKDSEQHCCNTCKAVFSSRNKLFQHLKDTNHALKVDSPAAADKIGKKKKGKKLK